MSSPLSAKIGWTLTRLVVPLWVLTGAFFKLAHTSPRTLPKETILDVADQVGLNLYYLLAALIGLEIVAAVVMLTLSRLARPMAILMLGLFCLILIGELMQGNLATCGCFGEIPVPPWVMLVIDGALLLGVLLFDPAPLLPTTPARWPVGAALVLVIAGFAGSFARVIPAGRAMVPNPDDGTTINDPDPGGGNTPAPPDDPTVNPSPTPLPGYWFTSDTDAWVGKPWREIELFTFMPKWPRDLDSGRRFVVFYGRTCEHCEDMFREDLALPALGSIVSAVEVPYSKTALRGPNAWPMPQTPCEHLKLPLGCDWIITTPLVVAVENGIVTCVQEGDHTECMGIR
jgi:hypothetical protein